MTEPMGQSDSGGSFDDAPLISVSGQDDDPATLDDMGAELDVDAADPDDTATDPTQTDVGDAFSGSDLDGDDDPDDDDGQGPST